MKNGSRKQKKVIVMVPYPAQGHVSPMMKLAESLQALGYRPVIFLPEFLLRQLRTEAVPLPADHQIVAYPDGISEGPTGFFEIDKAMEDALPHHLHCFLEAAQDDLACLVADVLASSAFAVAALRGVPAAGFWPAMAATYRLIASIPQMLQGGIIDSTGIPVRDGPISLKQDLPLINSQDLPWLIGSLAERQSKFKFWVRAIQRASCLRWLLVNSFPNEVHRNLEQGPIMYAIGFLKKHEQISKPRASLTFWTEDDTCLDWLEKQKPNSVVYVSLGTWFGPTDKSKVISLASSLENMGKPFLWALGPKWADGLPVGFRERICDRGKVVDWAPQAQVLRHKSVGCFLTHCGWNSITEAILSNKCLVCFPLAGDQQLNCVYVVDVWKIGVKIEGFILQEMNDSVNCVLNDTQMKRRIMKLSDNFIGEEASFKMTANLTYFLNKLKNIST